MNTWQYVVLKRLIEEMKETFIYKAAVADYATIATEYPTPSEGWTTQTLDDGKIYRFDGTDWIHVTTVTSGLWDQLSNDLIATQAEITAARKGEDTLEDKIDAIDSSLSEKANKMQEDWIYPTINATWTNLLVEEVPANPLRYRKDEFGVVSIIGRITNGASGTNIFTLPVGYRPSHSIYFLVARSGSTDNFSKGVILNAGNIYIYNNYSDITITISFSTN